MKKRVNPIIVSLISVLITLAVAAAILVWWGMRNSRENCAAWVMESLNLADTKVSLSLWDDTHGASETGGGDLTAMVKVSLEERDSLLERMSSAEGWQVHEVSAGQHKEVLTWMGAADMARIYPVDVETGFDAWFFRDNLFAETGNRSGDAGRESPIFPEVLGNYLYANYEMAFYDSETGILTYYVHNL